MPINQEMLKTAQQVFKSAKQAADDDTEKKEQPSAEKNDTSSNDSDETARKEKRRPAARARAEDLLRMNTTGGALADYLQPMSWGGARAGRARHIARALGEEPSFGVKYPGTASGINYALGGLLGAGIGGGLGALADNGPTGTALGALLGSSVGGLGGVLAGGYSRRNEMNRIKNKLEDSLVEDAGAGIAANNKPVNFGTLSSLLLPYAGPHRAGQADAYEALRDNTRYRSGTGRNVAYSANLVPYVNAVTAPVTGWAQNFMAKGRMSGQTESARPRERISPAEHNYGLDLKAAAAHKSAADPRAMMVSEGGMSPTGIGTGYLKDMKSLGNKIQREGNIGGAVAPVVGNVAGRALGGRLGGMAGNAGGALIGQQMRHVGANTAVYLGARDPNKPIPYGLSDNGLTNRPSPDSVKGHFDTHQTGQGLNHYENDLQQMRNRYEAKMQAIQNPMTKTQSARSFGAKYAAGLDLSGLQKYLPGAGVGAGAGALVGGLGGLMFPGKRRGRLGGALSGALAGAGLGGLAGGAAGGGAFGQDAQTAMADVYKRLGDLYNQANPVVARSRTELPAQDIDPSMAVGQA